MEFEYPKTVEKWCPITISAKGREDGNPFTDYFIEGIFESKNETVHVKGFYDGDGFYRVRFMPSFTGKYKFTVRGNFAAKEFSGTFEVSPPSSQNHGPVRVANGFHFAYEDGTPYYPIGTTCYVWTHQTEELQKKTLETLKNSPFNKIRFCVFPKHYIHNFNEPQTYPYVGKPCDTSGLNEDTFEYGKIYDDNDWDFKRFNPEHFRKFEKRIEDLMNLGIAADIIVMHPYDRWGFSRMDSESDDLYWNYVVARFAAYRNVWWSFANEYDLMPQKSIKDWERYAKIVCENDPYNHLRSIHNCGPFYDYSKPWITHCCIQRQDVYKTAEFTDEWRQRYKKPIVLDEICYEGNIDCGWGNISGQELVRRFWEATCRGGYAGHGETYLHPDDILWWSHGGELHGESPKRLKFLYDILRETPGLGLKPYNLGWDFVTAVPEGIGFAPPEYYLIYFGFGRPSYRTFYFDDKNEYSVEIIDTWDMTITPAGKFKGKFKISLPGKEYIALRIRKV
ncbi:MAG: DUF5605 domain-containing protein [Oscillospiraceae bacterium]|nr:DUF5605 domain-containing protein [Oscillospiraceae bacterium]